MRPAGHTLSVGDMCWYVCNSTNLGARPSRWVLRVLSATEVGRLPAYMCLPLKCSPPPPGAFWLLSNYQSSRVVPARIQLVRAYVYVPPSYKPVRPAQRGPDKAVHTSHRSNTELSLLPNALSTRIILPWGIKPTCFACSKSCLWLCRIKPKKIRRVFQRTYFYPRVAAHNLTYSLAACGKKKNKKLKKKFNY